MFLSTDRQGRVTQHDSETDAKTAAFEKGGKAWTVQASELVALDPKAAKKAQLKAKEAAPVVQ